VWQATTGNVVHRLRGPRHPILCLAFSPDGRWLASGSEDGHVQLWDAATGAEVRTLSTSAQSKSLVSLAFSPDSTRLDAASFEQAVKLWDPASGQEVFTLYGESSGVLCLAFSRDGSRLASGGYDCLGRDTSGVGDASQRSPGGPQ
jgi:WD40 repeat protein